MEVKSIVAGGTETEYLVFGEGNNVMAILPGLSVQSALLSSAAIAKEYSVFHKDFTVFVFDRRKDVPPVYTVSDMAEDTAQAFRALGLRDVCLFGASQGGMIALLLAAKKPELVGKLALGSSAAALSPEAEDTLRLWASLAREEKREALYLDFAQKVYPPSFFTKNRSAFIKLSALPTREELLRFSVLAQGSLGFDASSALEKVSCPVLNLSASDDGVLGAGAGERLAQAFENKPGCRSVFYSGYGHASYDLAPGYKEELLDFFLRG